MSGLQRRKPLGRSKPLQPGGPLTRYAPLGRGDAQLASVTPIRPVSDKRRAEIRQRAAMADQRWPARRDGTVPCAVWEAMQPDWCDRRASDLHEIVRRSQGGSITSEENTIPVCRTCNGLLADGPAWGYRIGVIRHDQLCCEGRQVCERYAEGGEAA